MIKQEEDRQLLYRKIERRGEGQEAEKYIRED